MVEKKDENGFFFPENVPLSNALIIFNLQTIQTWGYGNNFPIGIGCVQNVSAFKMGFIGSKICWKNKLDTETTVQIFHPRSLCITSMAHRDFALH